MTSGIDTLDLWLDNVLDARQWKPITKGLHYATVGELFWHLPRRYARRGELTAVAELPDGDDVSIVAEVRHADLRDMRQRSGKILVVQIGDGTGVLDLTFFNPRVQQHQLKPGVRGIFAGKITRYNNRRQLTHPNYELFEDHDPRASGLDGSAAKEWAQRPVPIYPATSKLATWTIAKTIADLLEKLDPPEDPVPLELRRRHGLVPLGEAFNLVHRPNAWADIVLGERALRFHEAFVLQTALLGQRAARRAFPSTPRVPGELTAEFDRALPFELTADQRRVGAEIETELGSGVPMNRLVQGEVGSGKTVVALRAMLTVAESGGQAALLAPTEVLAAQHLRSIVATLGPDLAARLRPTLVTGGLGQAARRKASLAVASGGARIVIGTHALLSDSTTFAELGLVVIDEQHRFGVDQRQALRDKGEGVHLLVLTATPIPRTVAMTVFGDLDVSTLRELPGGRSPIQSFVVALAEHPNWVSRVWARLGEELALGRQAFVVCPAIDERTPDEGVADPGADAVAPAPAGTPSAPARPVAAVSTLLEVLRAHPVFAGRRIEALHGRMSSEEKDSVMTEFAAGGIDVVVATTVIEVGVNVPNASVMVVLDAERFGISQLHQLRGRVGRGEVPGVALFVTSAEDSTLPRARVEAVAATLDGFELAQTDLELRREGDVLGAAQSGGHSSLKLLRVVKDAEVIAEAREAAEWIIDEDPILATHTALLRSVARRLDPRTAEFLGKA